MTNFEFLRKYFGEIYGNLREAELNIYSDPDTCIYKLRKVGEQFTKYIFKYEKVESYLTDNQYDNLEFLKKEKLIEQKYLALFHILRKQGNKTAHQNINSSTLAQDSLRIAFDISVYFYKKYWDKNFVEPQFLYIYYKDGLKESNRVLETEVNQEELLFFNTIIEQLREAVFRHIIVVKLDGWGSLMEIQRMSFNEFYDYYLGTLNELANLGMEYMQLLIKLRIIAQKKLGTSDGDVVNRELAMMLYSHTRWSTNNIV